MKVIPLVVGNLGTNCYLIEDKGEVGIIDPGDDGDFIIRKIEDLGAKPVWIVGTHGHFDHVLAVTELSLAYQIPFYVNSKDKFLLDRAKKTAEYFLGLTADPIIAHTLPLTKKTVLKLGSVKLTILETPGHTPGGVCLYLKKEAVLFSGDTIFERGIVGRTDFEYCVKGELEKSIESLLTLPAKTIVYPGHGKVTTLSEFKKMYFAYKKTRT